LARGFLSRRASMGPLHEAAHAPARHAAPTARRASSPRGRR